MPTAFLRRFCFCSLLFISLVVDTTAQRTARRRSVSTEEKNSLSTRALRDSTFIKADLVDSQQELATIQYNKIDEQEIQTIGEPVKKITPQVIEKKTGSTTSAIVDCKETNRVNKASVADSYPYLTEDGLRLYFTSNREGGHGRFFISTRKSITDPFGDPKVLSRSLTDGYYAGTLTADELTLCMVRSGEMYISIRADKNAEFPLPVKLIGATGHYHFGPSISPDGKEIFVTVTIESKDRTMVYKRTGTYQVEKVKELSLPPDLEAGPGQLSKDGLSYYFSIETKSSEHLWRFTRKSTVDDFTDLTELPEQIKGLKNILQPSLNRDGSVTVFVTSPNDIWDGDDILLVNTGKRKFDLPKIGDSLLTDAGKSVQMISKMASPQLLAYSSTLKEDLNLSEQSTRKTDNAENTKKVAGKIILSQLKIYPNPFTDMINIEIKELPADGALFNLYELSGKIIRTQKLTDQTTSVLLRELPAGVYTYQILDRKNDLIFSGKMIKSQ